MIIIQRDTHVGPVLRTLRTDAGLSTRDLAAVAHISKSGVAKRETQPGGTVGALIDHAAALGYAVALVPAAQASRPRYTTAEFAAEYALLRSEGSSRRLIAERLGMTRHAVDQAYKRAVSKGLLSPDRARRTA